MKRAVLHAWLMLHLTGLNVRLRLYPGGISGGAHQQQVGIGSMLHSCFIQVRAGIYTC